MLRFLIDENLPSRFAPWQGEAFEHVLTVGPGWSDDEVWAYAKAKGLVIVTKDADFSDRLMLDGPPPKVVHLRVGNLRLKALRAFISTVWPSVVASLESASLVDVFSDRIETVD